MNFSPLVILDKLLNLVFKGKRHGDRISQKGLNNNALFKGAATEVKYEHYI